MLDCASDADLDTILERFFADRMVRAERLGGQYALPWRRAGEALQGGKRLRPRLVMLTHDAFEGAAREDAHRAAAAFEVLHTALLLHDDVLDRDLVRRGRPNLAGLFAADALDCGHDPRGATSWGEASALLAGDLLISGAHALVGDIRHAAVTELHHLIDDALMTTAAGEHADVGFSSGMMHATQAEVLRMIEQKTAAYSFAAPLCAGALLADAPPESVTCLQRIGSRLGLLYQLRDDLLGVFGSEHTTGKSVISDLREGKRTLLVTFAEGTREWEAVRPLFGRAPLDNADADRLRDALHDSGAATRVHAVISEVRHEVQQTISVSPLPRALRDELARLAEHCAERES